MRVMFLFTVVNLINVDELFQYLEEITKIDENNQNVQ